MRSRYDYYDESCVLDSEGINFPDPLKINFNQGTLTKIPRKHIVTEKDIMRPWTMMKEAYGFEELDDILLLENAIGYVMELKPGDEIYLPEDEDLLGFVERALADKTEVNNY